MGLLDGVLGGQRPSQQAKPGLGSTVLAGVALALLVKAVRNHQSQSQASTQAAPHQSGGGLGDILGGGLSNILGGGAGGGLGGLIGGLGGAGGLGALIGRLQEKGLGSHAKSWVGDGENKPIAPHEVADALGEDNLAELEQRTGMSRQALLTTLAQELPDAVSQATPNGRLPEDQELHQLATGG